MTLTLTPTTLREANAFVEALHRHRGPARGCICVVSVVDDADTMRGVAIIGRPVARMLQDGGLTAEVTRLCTDGAPNACSMLYAASWRAVRALGYRRLVTYTLATESGSSLRAAGFTVVGQVCSQSWDRAERRRADGDQLAKVRWEVAA